MATFVETRNWQPVTQVCEGLACLIKQAIKGGVVAGLTLFAFQILTSLLVQGAPFYYFRMLAAVLVGDIALDAWHPLTVSVPVGLSVGLVISIVLAALFVFSLGYMPWPVNTGARILMASCAYGLLIWLAGYYVIAPLFGWTWFANNTNPLLQGLIANVLAYGLILGLVLTRRP